jgi:hypothetical protein
MTQYQQVLAAIKALNGEGTLEQIYAKIKEANPNGWKTKTPLASVSSYLSTNSAFKKDKGVWTLQNVKVQDGEQSAIRKSDPKTPERGLYFITVSPYIKISGAGFLFKIGQSSTVKKRLVAYSASLPVDTVQLISFYPIPDDVDLVEAEKEVNGELVGNENLGEDIFDHTITVHPYFGNHQDEWLQTLDINPMNVEDLNKLADIISNIVKTTITTLIAGEEEPLLES